MREWATSSAGSAGAIRSGGRRALAGRQARGAGGRGAKPPFEFKAPGHVLLPVLVAREILPRELALSEGGGALKESDVDEWDALDAGGLRYLFGDHLSHERDRDP